MSFFRYTCPTHGIFTVKQDRGGKSTECPTCHQDSKRILDVSTMIAYDVIDNGMMSKAVERRTDINELLDERNDNHEKSLKDD